MKINLETENAITIVSDNTEDHCAKVRNAKNKLIGEAIEVDYKVTVIIPVKQINEMPS